MRRAAVWVLIALSLLSLLWLNRSRTRLERTPSASPSTSPAAAPAPLSSSPDDPASASPVVEPLAPAGRTTLTSAAEPRARVRGRLVVAETGDPIRAVLPLSLRRLDLSQPESLSTQPDGTFTSAQEFPPGRLRARVEDEDGQELVEHEADFDPRAEGEWIVPIPARAYPTYVRGRVVDRRGEPLAKALARLVPLRALDALVEATADQDGRFELRGLQAGTWRFHVQGPWTRSDPAALTLSAGPNELGTIVLPEPLDAPLVLRFESAGGPARPQAWVVLRRQDGVGVQLDSAARAEAGPDGIFELRLERVPAEPCTLSLESLDGRVYEPERARVTPPATVRVRVSGAARRVGPRMRVRDAETHEVLAVFEVWTRLHGRWRRQRAADALPWGERELLGSDAWVVQAKGYRSVRAQRAPDGPEVVEVELERGFGQVLVFADVEDTSMDELDLGPRRALLAGVEVWEDGRFLGQSDADGLLLLDHEAVPGSLDFRLPGWRVVSSDEVDSEIRKIGLARSE